MNFGSTRLYSSEFKELPLELLVKILDWDALNMDSEKDLLGSVRFDPEDKELLKQLKAYSYDFPGVHTYYDQYLELLKEPELLVGINTKRRQKYPGFKAIKRSVWDDDYRSSRDYNRYLDKFEDDTDYEYEDATLEREMKKKRTKTRF